MTAPAACCLICLGADPPDAGEAYHGACLERLFDAPRLPRLNLDRAAVLAWPRRRGVKMSISGAQPKASLRLSSDGTSLFPVDRDGTYLIKPELNHYRGAPENEHLTMCLARLAGLRVAEHGLLRLKDGSSAYITRRFDRVGSSPTRKLRFEDFCQLSGKPSAAKQSGSAEECAGLALRYAGPAAARELFLLFVVSYWFGNGDLHLKNIALLEARGPGFELAPAYDLLSTFLYGDRSMTLPVGHRTKDIPRRAWIDFGVGHCGLSPEEAGGLLDALLSRGEAAAAMVERSPLPGPDLKQRYRWLLRKRGRALMR